MSKAAPFALDPLYLRQVSEDFARAAYAADYPTDRIPPALVGVENSILYDVSTFTANQVIEFFAGQTWGAVDAASQSVKLNGPAPANMLLGILGIYIRVPQVTADRADEDETQTQLAIMSRGRLICSINGQTQAEVPASGGMVGEVGYRSGAGAGSEFARGGIEAGGGLFLFDRPKIVAPQQAVSLQHIVEGDLMATAALDMTVIGGVLALVATTNGLS
jgi:hypothetical protein